METTEIKLGKKSQVVIPKKAREEIGIKEGESIQLLYEKGRGVIIPKKKVSITMLRGLGKEMWEKSGGGDKHLKEERASWED